MGLGQVHGPAPFAGGELGQVEVLLGVGAAVQDRRIGPVRQARIHGKRHVRRGRHLREGEVDHMRQALAAIGLLGPERRPAALHQGLVGGLEPVWRPDGVIGAPDAALLVAHGVQGREHLAGEPTAFLDDLGHHIHRGLGKARQVAVALDLQDVAQQEEVVTDRGLIGHGRSDGVWPGPLIEGPAGLNSLSGVGPVRPYLPTTCSRPSRRWRSI